MCKHWNYRERNKNKYDFSLSICRSILRAVFLVVIATKHSHGKSAWNNIIIEASGILFEECVLNKLVGNAQCFYIFRTHTSSLQHFSLSMCCCFLPKARTHPILVRLREREPLYFPSEFRAKCEVWIIIFHHFHHHHYHHHRQHNHCQFVWLCNINAWTSFRSLHPIIRLVRTQPVTRIVFRFSRATLEYRLTQCENYHRQELLFVMGIH